MSDIPTSLESELQVIGSLVAQPSLILEMGDLVQAADFVDQHHQAAFKAILDIDRHDAPLSVVTLQQYLSGQTLFSGTKATEYLTEVAQGTPTVAHAKYHGRKVVEASLKRRLLAAMDKTRDHACNGYTAAESLSEIIRECQALQRAVDALNPEESQRIRTAKSIVGEFIDGLERGEGQTVETGISDLDYALGGGPSYGEMVIIAGRPSHGKTMVVLQILDQMTGAGHDCLLLSEEMSHSMIAKRIMSRISSIGQDRWDMSAIPLRADVDAWQEDRAPLYVSMPCGTIESAVGVIERAVRGGIRIVAIDYAQLLRGAGRNSYEQTSDVSMRLREIISKHDILLFCLCQLSRKSEEHEGRPRMSDLKNSGQFEQDADVIIFVDWPSIRGDDNAQGNDYYLRIRKNRNRETLMQDIKLEFDRRRQTVNEANRDWEPNCPYPG